MNDDSIYDSFHEKRPLLSLISIYKILQKASPTLSLHYYYFAHSLTGEAAYAWCPKFKTISSKLPYMRV